MKGQVTQDLRGLFPVLLWVVTAARGQMTRNFKRCHRGEGAC